MANALYDKGRNKFARGDLQWLASGGDTFKVFLLDNTNYTPDLNLDEFLDDIATSARAGNSGGTGDADAVTLTLIDPSDGVVDANDATVTSVTHGSDLYYILIYMSTGTESTSPLVALIDTATGLPVTPNGGNINIVWDDGTNKIFKL